MKASLVPSGENTIEPETCEITKSDFPPKNLISLLKMTLLIHQRHPFFFEGAEMFRTPIEAVHTRSIIDPDYALKLTRRRGKNNYAILVASDKALGNYSEKERNNLKLLPTISKFIDKNAYIGILRYKRSMMADSNIGYLTTS